MGHDGQQAVSGTARGTLTGYALLVGLISVTSMMVLQSTGEDVDRLFTTVSDDMGRVAGPPLRMRHRRGWY